MKDGGRAFPRPGFELSESVAGKHDSPPQDGMTLRDWFAGMIVQGRCQGGWIPGDEAAVALMAYKLADAMIAEREKSK